MEKEHLVHSLEHLKNSGLHVYILVTDRHPQALKYTREAKLSVTHYYDVWHVAKGQRVLCEINVCPSDYDP